MNGAAVPVTNLSKLTGVRRSWLPLTGPLATIARMAARNDAKLARRGQRTPRSVARAAARGGLASLALLASLLAATTAWGQATPDSVRQRPTSARGRLPVTGCAGQPIHEIVVIAQPPYVERLPKAVDFLREAARAGHSTTRDEVIRGFLLMQVGELCNQFRRAESERLLRAQPYIVDARIRVYDDEAGGVRLEVETRDEFSLILEPVVTAAAPFFKAIRVGDANVRGYGRRVAVQWRDGGPYADVLGAQYTDYQFGGGRNELRVVGTRREHGQQLRAELVRPFYTDFQQYAFLASAEGIRDHAIFRRPGFEPNALNVARRSLVVGGLARFGTIGRLRLLGLSLTSAERRPDAVPVRLTRTGILPDSGPPLGRVYAAQSVARMNALFGVRFLRFVPVEGFDALTGTQDIRTGLQVSAVYGQSLQVSGASPRDRFMGASLYAGAGGQRSFVGLQLSGEARQTIGAHDWADRIGTGRVAWYFRPAVRQLTTVSAEWSGARDMQQPFQLSLADYTGGLRGYARSDEPGAQRLVMRAEQRLVLGSRANLADVGMALFVEAGKLWAERSVPYSVTTPWRSAVGVSLLAAVPPRSRRMWRVDVAMPVSSDPRRRLEIRFSNEDRTRVFWREPDDVMAGRDPGVPISLFRWP